MSNEFVSIDVSKFTIDANRVTKKLGQLMPALQTFIPEAVAPAIVKLMEIYPEENHTVTRKQAYGKTFQSARQRRKVFALIREGKIPYTRTYAMRQAWVIEGKGKDTRVVNRTKAALYTMDDERRARLNKLVGWMATGERLRQPVKVIGKAALAGVKKAIKKVGLK